MVTPRGKFWGNCFTLFFFLSFYCSRCTAVLLPEENFPVTPLDERTDEDDDHEHNEARETEDKREGEQDDDDDEGDNDDGNDEEDGFKVGLSSDDDEKKTFSHTLCAHVFVAIFSQKCRVSSILAPFSGEKV